MKNEVETKPVGHKSKWLKLNSPKTRRRTKHLCREDLHDLSDAGYFRLWKYREELPALIGEPVVFSVTNGIVNKEKQ